jgi:CubicO group peptidase (beta-lactamase class C family)
VRSETSIAAVIEEMVTASALAGAAALIWRDGKVVKVATIGWRDVEARLPMERDTLFRIASMTKPITSTAALMLFEEGRFTLDDPITHWAPEFSLMRVLMSPDGLLDQTYPAERPITFRDLLTHRSGITYGAFHTGPILAVYEEALGGEVDTYVEPDDWIARLAALPLIDQPGIGFHYGRSTDLLGLLLARIEDAPLSDVLRRRIFDPLGMKDTGFTVPREKRDRQAGMYGFDKAGRLIKRLTATGNSTLPERPEDMKYEGGGGGLWSTLDDYLAFARIFVGAGAVDGVRILGPKTLALMTSNHLSESQRGKASLLSSGHGFGLGVAVVLDPKNADPVICGGGVGSVGWPDAWGGWWQADPSDNSVLIFLAHNLVELNQFAQGIGFEVFDAILRFQSLASSSSQ